MKTATSHKSTNAPQNALQERNDVYKLATNEELDKITLQLKLTDECCVAIKKAISAKSGHIRLRVQEKVSTVHSFRQLGNGRIS